MHSRLIRWPVTKLVASIEITSAECRAGQQSFIAWEAKQSTQHGPIISVTFYGNLCYLNLLSPVVMEQIHSLDKNSFQGRGERREDSQVTVGGRLRNAAS